MTLKPLYMYLTSCDSVMHALSAVVREWNRIFTPTHRMVFVYPDTGLGSAESVWSDWLVPLLGPSTIFCSVMHELVNVLLPCCCSNCVIIASSATTFHCQLECKSVARSSSGNTISIEWLCRPIEINHSRAKTSAVCVCVHVIISVWQCDDPTQFVTMAAFC